MLDDKLKHVAIIGAGGKMGSGIALLTALEVARLELSKRGDLGTGNYKIILIDTHSAALNELKEYLRQNIKRYAEKNIIALREIFSKHANLVSNEEIIRYFSDHLFDNVQFSETIEAAQNAQLIFETINEDISAKIDLLNHLKKICHKDAYFLSNTSAIPISLLGQETELNERVVGFHFYNPPAVQKTIEIVFHENCPEEIRQHFHSLAERIGKKSIEAKDVSGFIGNGFLIREIKLACQKVKELSQEKPLFEAIYCINKVTQESLLRPMGIFQLIDYIGIDVVANISRIMSEFLQGPSLANKLIEDLLYAGNRGGHTPDGNQNKGFFIYENNQPIGVFDIKGKEYRKFQEGEWKKACDDFLGETSPIGLTWKDIYHDSNKKELLKKHFDKLLTENGLAGQLTQSFLGGTQSISDQMLRDEVVSDKSTIDIILQEGFLHPFGIDFINEYQGLKNVRTSS